MPSPAATTRAVMAKLFLADRAAGGRPGGGFESFFAALTADEAEHPIAAWLARKRGVLDWDENVSDMVCRYFRIPPKPLWPHEDGAGHDAAAVRLEARLRGPAAGRRAGRGRRPPLSGNRTGPSGV